MSFRLWSKLVVASLSVCVGGPALIYYISPTEEELFQKYNPELQKRSLANRRQNQQDFDTFVEKLKRYSKSDKPIWEEAAADEAATRAATLRAEARSQTQQQSAVAREIREEALRAR